MDLGVISVRYARALLKSAALEKQEDNVYKDMKCLSLNYIEVPELRFAIDNPMLSVKKKQMVLETACGDSPAEQTKRFITLVLEANRGDVLQFMAVSYMTLYRKQKNIVCGKLTTASSVDAAIELKMKQLVEANTHGTVEFNTEVDPELVGGFVLEYDTFRLDASIKTKLRNILTELKNRENAR